VLLELGDLPLRAGELLHGAPLRPAQAVAIVDQPPDRRYGKRELAQGARALGIGHGER
jgi:hypothetical protein